MKALRRLLDKQESLFTEGPLKKLYPLFEAGDTFFFTPGKTTRGAAHVRDALDLKRLMTTVIVALLGTVVMALYNTGYQAHLAISAGAEPLAGWRTELMGALGLAFDPSDVLANSVHGALYFVPLLLVSYTVGIAWETLFASLRGHEINEGFLVTGMLYPLILPPTLPLWQAALGISFGVVIGKEVFGGTGKNIFNPALLSRAFLFFAYAAHMSGDAVWVAAQTRTDGVSGATWLARAAESGQASFAPPVSWWDAFVGLVPGSMGETSALACLIGAIILVVTGVGSWRVMGGVTAGTVAMALLLNGIGSQTNPFFDVPFWWHFVLGGWAFGTVFMATDPVSGAFTNTGRWIYGVSIGVLAILVRVINPAYPEGMMLAILLMNAFAATIDHYVVSGNIKRRRARYAA